MSRTIRVIAETSAVYRRLNPDNLPPEVLENAIYDEVPVLFDGMEPVIDRVWTDDSEVTRFAVTTRNEMDVDGTNRSNMTMDDKVRVGYDHILSGDEQCPLIEREHSEILSWEVVR